MKNLKVYRVRREEVKSVLIMTDSPDGAMELANDYYYEKARTEVQECHEPYEDMPVDDEKIYLDPDMDATEIWGDATTVEQGEYTLTIQTDEDGDTEIDMVKRGNQDD